MKTLVLCIDRDDDIGRHTQIKGPIVGWDSNLDVAQKLALADPQDTDVNALFGALNIAKNIEAEVVTLTGDRNVGIVSDNVVAQQLDYIIDRFHPESVIVVTDGLDDQQVLPIIQSRVKVESVQTIVVRQSKELEKAYFKIIHFMKEITEDPTLARLIFGIPGIAFLLLAIFGLKALTLILGIFGLYLVIKGFGWEDEVFDTFSEFASSLSIERISTLIYFIAVFTMVISLVYGYGDMQKSALDFTDANAGLSTLSVFILNSFSVELLVLTLIIAIAGRVIDDWGMGKYIQIKRYLVLMGFIVMVRVIVFSGAKFISSEDYSLGNFVLTGLISVAAFSFWVKLTEFMFIEEIEAIKEIIGAYTQKQVNNMEGKNIGKVSKVVVLGMKLKEIKVGRKRIPASDIVSGGDVIVVNTK